MESGEDEEEMIVAAELREVASMVDLEENFCFYFFERYLYP